MDIDYEKLIDNVPGTIFRCACDEDWTMMFISSGIEALSGFPASDFLYNKVRTYESIIHPEDTERVAEVVNGCAQALQSWELEYRIITREGAIKWVHDSGVGSYDDDGKLLYLDGFVADVTSRLNLEAELSQARKLESIGNLAAGVAHEINTPSQYVGDNLIFLKENFADILELVNSYHAAVLANSDETEINARFDDSLAIREKIDFDYLVAETPKAIDQALDGIERIRAIVTAMKAFSHPTEKEMKLFDLNKLIESTTTVAVNEWKYVADLELDLDPDLPEINCFAGELGQVLLNIVVNAAHAIADNPRIPEGQKGKILVTSAFAGDKAEIRISDNGSGMDEIVKEKIFDPFFTTKDVGKGTGQGLSIAYATIVDQHGGSISVDSSVGKGTTFILHLPISQSTPEAA